MTSTALSAASDSSAARYGFEPRVYPTPQHMGPFGRQEALSREKCDHPRPEQFLQRLETYFGHNVKQPRSCEQPVSHQRIQVRVKVKIFSRRIAGAYRARVGPGKSWRDPGLLLARSVMRSGPSTRNAGFP